MVDKNNQKHTGLHGLPQPLIAMNAEAEVLENIAKYQAVDNPLTPLTVAQLDILYKLGDLVAEIYQEIEPVKFNESAVLDNLIKTNMWFYDIEERMRDEILSPFTNYSQKLASFDKACQQLCDKTNDIISSVNNLHSRYNDVSVKTNSLYNLSDQLMKEQSLLKEKKSRISQKLQYFTILNTIQNNFRSYTSDINSSAFEQMLDNINASIDFFNQNRNLADSMSYKYRFESLLSQACQSLVKQFTNVIRDTAKQVVNSDRVDLLQPDTTSALLIPTLTAIPSVDTAGSFYYGKFQNAASKVNRILRYLESKADLHNEYKRTLSDCRKAYFMHRSPMISGAVARALSDLRDRHKMDQVILFRSAGLFVMKVCEDEAACYYYYFGQSSPQLSEYLAMLCEKQYDIMRPNLITINHLEVLTELCSSLKEMMTAEVQNNEVLEQFVRTTSVLLHDVEERLVFRANVFFQNDLASYKPSPGDLAYPEKLQQMEHIIEEMDAASADAQSTSGSVESPETSHMNSLYMGNIRSYTGNSAADLHGMWYPTVKRTLVCLSRLYLCLDREIFQGLAQEALLVCIASVEHAANLISTRRTALDAQLFQIKHLLIIREQIAPFQVDFTVRETSLDFSNVRNAAVGLVNNRDKLFHLNTTNALLEFLLEGTPTVREYLVDSRKEIDKQLKSSCEAFIADTTRLLIGPLQKWILKSEAFLKEETTTAAKFGYQEWTKPQALAELVTVTQRNIKTMIYGIQTSMKLYLSNRETEFILFRPIKNNIIYCFMHVEQLMTSAKFTAEDRLIVACPSAEVLNVLITSMALNTEHSLRPPTTK